MRWASALSQRPSLEAAVKEVVEIAQDSLRASPDLGLVFISSAFSSEYSRLMPLLQEHLHLPTLIGCGAGGVIGMNSDHQAEEIEGEPALSLTLAHLPDVEIHPFHLSADDLPDLDSSPDRWIDLIGVKPEDQPQFILLVDPYFGQINDFLLGLDYAYPGSVKVGGLASTGTTGGGTGVFSGSKRHSEEIVGLALCGNIVIETIVAQGCRPIGHPYRITQGERNIVLEVETPSEDSPLETTAAVSVRLSPLEALQDLVKELNEEDRQLAQHSLFVGMVRDEFKQKLEPGDFLIRNLIGVDPRVGAIAIGDRVRPGQRIQFHLRDSRTSAEDLELLIEHYQRQASSFPLGVTNAGALMFSCLGRGEGLYGEPNFDSGLFRRYFDIPLSGFFCNGEIGPVGNVTFLHGYTSVFGIFRQRDQ
jgi:small ligand-binding sensory domain FIST